jgi:hypothetical protein
MKTTVRLAIVSAVVALFFGAASRDARAGFLDTLKSKAKEEAQKKALEIAKEKAAKMLKKEISEPPKEPEDEFMGEYGGTFTPAGGGETPARATVVGYLDRKKGAWHWDVVLTWGRDVVDLKRRPEKEVKLEGARQGSKLVLSDGDWSGQITGRELTAAGKDGKFALRYTVRKSPTSGAKPPAGAVVLLPFQEGKPTSLDEWTNKKWVLVSDGSAMVRGGGSLTTRKFKDFKVHIEFYCPYQPDRTGQGRANSGCYMHSKYEVQVLDSFGLAGRNNEAGGIYTVRDPDVNAALPPGQWQTYDITFRGPRLAADGTVKEWGKFVEVLHNGVKVQENVEVRKVTTGGRGKDHVEVGPIMLQDHGNPVRYRNIWLLETRD